MPKRQKDKKTHSKSHKPLLNIQMINRTMTLDAGKYLRSVIVTEKDELMVVQDHTYPTCSKFLKCDY